jgi:hypothetical protein
MKKLLFVAGLSISILAFVPRPAGAANVPITAPVNIIFAQATPDTSTPPPADPALPAPPSVSANPFQGLLDGLLGKYGWISTVLLVIGAMRVTFKPIMLAIESFVKETPSTSDDANLQKFEGGPIYKVISFLLDFGASIKLPLVKPPTT